MRRAIRGLVFCAVEKVSLVFVSYFELNERQERDHNQNGVADCRRIAELRVIHERQIVDVLRNRNCCVARTAAREVFYLVEELERAVYAHNRREQNDGAKERKRDFEKTLPA